MNSEDLQTAKIFDKRKYEEHGSKYFRRKA